MMRVLNRTFGPDPVESITTEDIERWKTTLIAERRLSNRTLQKYLVTLNGIFKRAMRVWRIPRNPAAEVERPRLTRPAAIDVFSGEEVMALVRAADSEQDAAVFATAAFTGLRQGELLALHWRDVDFAGSAIRVRASYTNGHLTSPKSGKVRSIPMAPRVGETLARLGQRELFTGEDDL